MTSLIARGLVVRLRVKYLTVHLVSMRPMMDSITSRHPLRQDSTFKPWALLSVMRSDRLSSAQLMHTPTTTTHAILQCKTRLSSLGYAD